MENKIDKIQEVELLEEKENEAPKRDAEFGIPSEDEELEELEDEE